MRRTHLWQVVFVCAVFIAMGAASGRMPSIFADDNARGWPQWGQNPQHSGSIGIAGQSPSEQLAKMTYDPFVAQEQAENNGELLAHYQAPLTDGQDVFMEFISGTYNSCNPTGSYTPFPCGTANWLKNGLSPAIGSPNPMPVASWVAGSRCFTPPLRKTLSGCRERAALFSN